ncbi:MAG: GNAT family N-acetyltransferase [Coriobacteriales bacterium]|jgi:predicted GNAT family N-acyltransferase
MSVTFKIGDFESEKFVRTKVFIEEQGFEYEFDEHDKDPSTVHITAWDGDELLGCIRMLPPKGDDPDKDTWTLGRLAVLKTARGRGIGGLLVAEGESVARSAGAKSVKLHAQCRVTPFYEKQGYVSFGPIEKEEHVDHIWMRKSL